MIQLLDSALDDGSFHEIGFPNFFFSSGADGRMNVKD